MKRFFSYAVVAAITIAAALTVSSCDDEVKYTVRFDSKGGTPTPQEQTVKTGSKVSKPADPTRENYTFTGWATADNATSPLWNFETETVTGDMILFARWAINTYLVTFDSDGGSAVTAQNVAHGSAATKPANPTKTIPSGLYLGTPTGNHIFNGWYYGDREWDFATPITTPITLKARWILPGNAARIESVLPNDIVASVTYVNANSNRGEEYTLLIGAPNVRAGAQTLNAANAKLTIIGLGEERTITPSSIRWFTIDGNNATSLTIGQNITIRTERVSGIASVHDRTVSVQRGSLIMRDGSKITEARSGAVYVGGINASFKMEGGEISGNNYGAGNNDVGGVYVNNGATFEMSGGNITGNTTLNSYGGVEDLYIENGCTFRLSGNARIGAMVLNATNATSRATVTINGNYSGTVTRFHLRGGNTNANTTATWWTNVRVIENGTASVINMFNNGLGNFGVNFGISGNPISATHVLNASGFLVLKEN